MNRPSAPAEQQPTLSGEAGVSRFQEAICPDGKRELANIVSVTDQPQIETKG